jgi:hypothetical protein
MGSGFASEDRRTGASGGRTYRPPRIAGTSRHRHRVTRVLLTRARF